MNKQDKEQVLCALQLVLSAYYESHAFNLTFDKIWPSRAQVVREAIALLQKKQSKLTNNIAD